MTTPERSNPKRDPSTDAAGASRSRRGCMENADFLKRGDQNSPGPCYATPPPSWLSPGPQFSFTSKHMPFRFANAMGNPGPGAHMPENSPERYCSPSFSFGSRQRDVYFSNSPGPCYATPPPSLLSPGPKFSITSRHMPSRFAIAIEED